MYELAMVPKFSQPNACTSSSLKLLLLSSSTSSSSSIWGKCLCVGVSYINSFEVEAIAGVGIAKPPPSASPKIAMT